MKKTLHKYKIPILAFLALFLLGGYNAVQNTQNDQFDPQMGQEMANFGNADLSQWFVFDNFTGFKTKADPSKIDQGANPNGQNTIINDGDRISVRDFGYTLFGQSSTTEEYIGSLHTFRRRDGENIMMRSHGTFLEYYEKNNSTWEILTSTSTSPSTSKSRKCRCR